MRDVDPDAPYRGWGTALRSVFRPVLDDLFGLDNDTVHAMQAIGRMKEAASHLKEVAEGLASGAQTPPNETSKTFQSIDEATDDAVDFH